MGSKLEHGHSQLEDGEQKGAEIKEVAEQKIEEAQESKAALDAIEGVDDDDKAALEAARSEANDIAKTIAESEIRAPGAEVSSSLEAIAEQAGEDSNTEREDAEKASETTGDFQGPGAELASRLQESAEKFQELSDESSQAGDEIRSETEQAAAELEGIGF